MMKKDVFGLYILSFGLFAGINHGFAQNPIILSQFTADPTARVFEGRVYVYPSHDISCGKGQGFLGFCMADYHVFSSKNLTDWVDHGVILSQNKMEWVDSTSYSLWAPDCIYKDGKYYFYFSARAKNQFDGFSIGVAVANKPYGPFKPEAEPLNNVFGIDPNLFIDKDGQAYLYWGGGEMLLMSKLQENMKELATEPQEVMKLPEGFKEGSFLFERKGIYYFTFSYAPKSSEQLVYAMGKTPMGPFEYKGVIMDESTGCWTNHHSILEYKGQWYLFYHYNDLSPKFDKNRSIKVDSLFFNKDGTIRKVVPTLRGVGITQAAKKIQIDRYTSISKSGASIDYLNALHKNKGWKTILKTKNAWVQYNCVDFSGGNLQSVNVNARSSEGGSVEVRIDRVDGPLLAQVIITKNSNWGIVDAALAKIPSGIHNLFVVLPEAKQVEIDWISFK